jgi:hypothetical protein
VCFGAPLDAGGGVFKMVFFFNSTTFHICHIYYIPSSHHCSMRGRNKSHRHTRTYIPQGNTSACGYMCRPSSIKQALHTHTGIQPAHGYTTQHNPIRKCRAVLCRCEALGLRYTLPILIFSYFAHERVATVSEPLL